MKRFTRRSLLRASSLLSAGLVQAMLVASCRRRRPVDTPTPIVQEATRPVTQAPEETEAPPTPAPSRTPRAARTPTPAPRDQVIIVADVTDYGWTHFLQRMTPTFEEMFPHVRLQWRSLTPWRDYPQRVAAYHASGLLGDLLEAPFGALMADWARERVIQPLDDLITLESLSLEGIFQGALGACRFGGKQYGLPFLAHAGENLLLYSQSLFGREGVSPPAADWTLSDLGQASRALTHSDDADPSGARYGYAPRLDLPGAFPLLSLFGANLLSDDGSECAISSEGGLECLHWAYDGIYKDGSGPKPFEIQGGYLDMLRHERLAMVRQSFGALQNLGQSAEVDAVIYPQHPLTGARASCASGVAYCITQRSRAPLDAFQWLKYASGREIGVQMLLNAHLTPGARMASWTDPRIVERFPVCAQIARAANDAHVQTLPRNLRVTECLDAWNTAVASLLRNEMTPADCLAAIHDKVSQALQMPPA